MRCFITLWLLSGLCFLGWLDSMSAKLEKVLGTVISAVLIFSLLIPGIAVTRPRKAEAIAPAVPAAVQIFGTALVAGGFYVASSNMEQYASSLGKAWDEYLAYCNSQSASYAQEMQDAINASYDSSSSSVDVSMLRSTGVLSSLNDYWTYLQNSDAGIITVGGSSSRAVESRPLQDLGDSSAPGHYVFGLPARYSVLLQDSHVIGYAEAGKRLLLLKTDNYWGQVHLVVSSPVGGVNCSWGKVSGTYGSYLRPYFGATSYSVYTFDKSTLQFKQQTSINSIGSYFQVTRSGDWVTYIDIGDAGYFYGDVLSEPTLAQDPLSADLISGNVADLPQRVSLLDVDEAMLQQGVSYQSLVAAEVGDIGAATGEIASDVAGIRTGIGVIDGILNGLLGVVSGIAANVQSIWNTWSGFASQPFDWLLAWWNALSGWWVHLLDWVDSTPVGQLVGGVVDAVNGLGLPIAGVLDGVLALPGSILGGLSGVLDGIDAHVLSGFDAIVDALSGVLAVDWVDFAWPSFEMPNIRFEMPSADVPLFPDSVMSDLDSMLREKAPICYVIRMGDSLTSMVSNWSSNRSFSFSLDLPYAEGVTFDGSLFLEQRLGGFAICDLLRVLVTALVCFGLLFRSYKVVEKGLGGVS